MFGVRLVLCASRTSKSLSDLEHMETSSKDENLFSMHGNYMDNHLSTAKSLSPVVGTPAGKVRRLRRDEASFEELEEAEDEKISPLSEGSRGARSGPVYVQTSLANREAMQVCCLLYTHIHSFHSSFPRPWFFLVLLFVPNLRSPRNWKG